jgi:hypothetical protein
MQHFAALWDRYEPNKLPYIGGECGQGFVYSLWVPYIAPVPIYGIRIGSCLLTARVSARVCVCVCACPGGWVCIWRLGTTPTATAIALRGSRRRGCT